jgi:hypothetical protein
MSFFIDVTPKYEKARPSADPPAEETRSRPVDKNHWKTTDVSDFHATLGIRILYSNLDIAVPCDRPRDVNFLDTEPGESSSLTLQRSEGDNEGDRAAPNGGKTLQRSGRSVQMTMTSSPSQAVTTISESHRTELGDTGARQSVTGAVLSRSFAASMVRSFAMPPRASNALYAMQRPGASEHCR